MIVNGRNTFTILRPENRGNVLVELNRGFIVNVNGRNTFTVLRPEGRGKTRNRGKDKSCTDDQKVEGRHEIEARTSHAQAPGNLTGICQYSLNCIHRKREKLTNHHIQGNRYLFSMLDRSFLFLFTVLSRKGY